MLSHSPSYQLIGKGRPGCTVDLVTPGWKYEGQGVRVNLLCRGIGYPDMANVIPRCSQLPSRGIWFLLQTACHMHKARWHDIFQIKPTWKGECVVHDNSVKVMCCFSWYTSYEVKAEIMLNCMVLTRLLMVHISRQYWPSPGHIKHVQCS